MLKHSWLIVLVAVLAGGALVFAFAASGDDGHGKGHRGEGNGQKVFRASLAPNHIGDPTIHGVAPAPLAWKLDRGEVRIKRSGEFDLRVQGLVLATTGTTGTVTMISASLFCGADSTTTAAVTTNQAALSPSGNARIEQDVTLPATCLAPVVTVHPGGALSRYIAISGW